MNSTQPVSFKHFALPCGGRWRPFFAYLLWLVLLSFAIPLARADETVCARVKIEIKQELTLERQAFDAQMKINNTTDSGVIENVSVVVKVTDENGTPVATTSDPNDLSAKFFLRVSDKQNISDVEGSGTVNPQTSATIDWLLIPAPGSAGETPFGKKYLVGATLTYTFNGERTVLDVSPDVITVKPLPLLTLDYFLPRDVSGDDPLTVEIEPVEPFTLGVRVKNTGQADANNLKIDSAQPKIIENKQGLLINFILTGSYVDDAPVQNTLLIDFGGIAAGTSKMGRWNMETTLSGKFTEFTARFSHSDELGGALTSILQATNTHTLIHDVRVDLPGRDAVHDFLAQDSDAVRIFESDAADSDVTDRSGVALLAASGSRYHLSFPATAGFVYVKLPDPFNGQKVLGPIVRADGKVMGTENVWLSKTRNEQSKQWQYWVNFFDVNTPGGYDTEFQDPPLTAHPPVLQFIANHVTQEARQVSFIVEASSPDGKPVSLSAAPLPSGARFVQEASDPQSPGVARAVLDWTPTRGTPGDYLIVYTASDGSLSATRSASIKVESTGLSIPAPAANNDSGTTRQTVKLALPVLANDRLGEGAAGFNLATLDLDPTTPDVDSSRTLAGEGYFTANPDGTVSFEPLPSFSGVSTVVYSIKDNLGQSSNPANITVTVTGPGNPNGDNTTGEPAANPDTGTTAVNTSAILDVKINDVASVGETLDLNSVDLDTATPGVQSSRITLEGAWVARTDGSVAFTPMAGYMGLASLPYAISDTAHKTAQSTLAFVVIGGTHALAQDDSASTRPSTPVVLHILNNDSPSDGGILAAGTIDLNAATLNQVDVAAVQPEGVWMANPDGTVSFSPSTDYQASGKAFTGTASLAYAVTDSNAWRASAVMTVTVNPTQTIGPPSATNDSASTLYNAPVSLDPASNDKANPGAILDPTTIDLNPATPALDWSQVTAEGSWQVNAEGTVTFSPAALFAGVTAVQPYRIRDSIGNYAGAGLTVSVAPPSGLSVSGTVFHDVSQNKLQDGNEPGTDAGGLFVTALDSGNQAVSTVAVDADGSYSLPIIGNAHYTLVLSTTLNGTTPSLPARWSNTGENSDGLPDGSIDGRLSINAGISNLTGRNFGIIGAPPVANNDRVTTPHDTSIELAILDNDAPGQGAAGFDPATVDLDPDTLGIQTSKVISGVGTYSVNPATGLVSFDPLPTFAGISAIGYQVKDNLGRISNSATITVVVGPDAVDDSNTTAYNVLLSGSLSGNDLASTGSSYAKVASPSHGNVVVNPDGSYLYTPANGYSGSDSFTYKLCLPSPDDTLCDTATVNLTIAAPVIPPELQVQMGVSSDQPAVGMPFFYTLTVSNNAGPTSGLAQLIDTIPAGVRLTKVNSTDAGWVCLPAVSQAQALQGGNGATLTCGHTGPLVAGSQTITLTAVPTAVSGSYINQATITGDGQTPNAANCDGSAQANCAQATITPKNPRLELVEKVALLPVNETGSPDGKIQADEKLSYTFTLTNRGDVALSPLSLADVNLDNGSLSCAGTTTQGRAFSLAGANNTLLSNDGVSCIGIHTATTTDATAGRVEDAATATGKAPDGTPSQSTSTAMWNNAPSRGQLSLTKIAAHNDADGDGAFDQGETVSYRFIIRNVGSVSLSNITINDPLLPSVSCSSSVLSAGAQVTCTAPDYVLTHADETLGQIINTATVSGLDTDGHTVTDTDSKVLNSRQTAALELKHSAVLATDQGPVGLTAGDTLAYTLVATNNGAVALTNVTLTDTQFGAALQANGACSPTQGSTLNPGDRMVCTASYTLQEGEADPIVNTANVTGKPLGRNAPVDAASQSVVPYAQAIGPSLYTLGNRVWLDSNDNGIMDSAETGIDGVVVRLQIGNGAVWNQASYADNSLIPDQVTSSGGYYQFSNVPLNTPGQKYRLAILPLNFKADLTGTKPLYGASSSYIDDASALPWADSHDQGVGTSANATEGTLSRTFDLAALPPGVTVFNGLDFGFVKSNVAASPDLVITNTASTQTVKRNGTLTYTLLASNAVGSGNLTKVTAIIDNLPAGMTVQGTATTLTAPGWSCTVSANRQSVTCAFKGSLPLAGGADFGGAIVIPVNVGSTTATGSVSNTATITKLGGEPSFANNAASASVTVNP